MTPEDAQRHRLNEFARHTLLGQALFADPGRLFCHGSKWFSRGDEDGIVEGIFRRIGARHRARIKFGVGSGLEKNTAADGHAEPYFTREAA